MHIARLLIDRRVDEKNPDGHLCHMLLPVQVGEDVSIEILQCAYLNDGVGCSIMKITNNSNKYKESDFLTAKDQILGEYSIIKTRKDQYLATVVNNNCKFARILSECGCFLTSAIPRNDYEIEWTVFSLNSTYITHFISRMKEEGYGVKKLSFELMDADMVLTPRQEEVVDYAYNNGYYDSPKKIHIEELCEKFNCTKSTMSVILKNAERKLIGAHLSLNKTSKYY